MIAVIALAIGVAAGIFLEPSVPLGLQPYLPIAVVAALDAVFGGVRAVMDGVFDDKVFVISFISNVLIAAFIVFLGDQLGVGLEDDAALLAQPRADADRGRDTPALLLDLVDDALPLAGGIAGGGLRQQLPSIPAPRARWRA